jgi:tetratricopeptide (TPR) repeat protein
MSHADPALTADADAALTERPVRTYLGDGETLHATLSNTRVGVERADAEGTHRIEPGEDSGAVAAVTDCRLLFVVGRPEGDDTISVPYVEFESVDARTEMLTRTLVVETTADAAWEFTVRRSDALDDAVAHLSSAVPTRLVECAERRREQADELVDAEDRQCRIDALEASVDAFRRATTVVDDPEIATAATRDSAESAIADLVDTYLARTRETASAGNWWAETGDVEDALDRYEEADRCLDRALELAETYPPGDADAITAEKEDLQERIEAVEVSASVSSALD